MDVSTGTVMAIKSYQNQADILFKNYLLSAPYIPYTSVLGGLVASKLAYDFTQVISTFYIKVYSGLTKVERVEWNNRGMSSIHAVFITALSMYLVFWSDLFADQRSTGLITLRSSQLSNFGLGVSVGYFIADVGMIFWFYPSLGGMEYFMAFLGIFMSLTQALLLEQSSLVLGCTLHLIIYLYSVHWRLKLLVIHHSLAAIAVSYSMLSGEGQIYTYMCLISEMTTPEINMRWYLDIAGLKKSTSYLVNGGLMFIVWLIARILLFLYVFHHIYLNYDQVMMMSSFGCLVVFVVPAALFVMNLMWFMKITNGLIKTLYKRK